MESEFMDSGIETAVPDARAGLAHERVFLGIIALLFIVSVWGTISWCGSMSGGMPMPGGWTMSMAWMRMAGQTWLSAAASFIGMWVVMMAAMIMALIATAITAERLAPKPEWIACILASITTAPGLS